MPQNNARRQSKKPLLNKDIIAVALFETVVRSGWKNLSVTAIARVISTPEAPVTAADLRLFAGGGLPAVLGIALDWVEAETLAAVSPYLGDSWRDNLMEILMARFDIANRYRAAFTGLPAYLKHQPALCTALLPRLFQTSERLLAQAGFKMPDPPVGGIVIIPAFAVLYLTIVKTWCEDEAPDMAKTMAVIDKRLEWLQKLSGMLGPKAAGV